MPRISVIFFLLILCCPFAEAKKITFDSRNGLGLGPVFGVTGTPFINYIPEPLSASSTLTPYYGLQPFFDFGNWALQPNISYYKHPKLSGLGTGYSESAEPATFAAHMRLAFIPLYFNARRSRVYFGLSLGSGYTYLTNKRKYTTGQEYTERLKGKGSFFTSFVGAESFLVQQWASGFELGYRNYYVDNLNYNGNTDSAGATQTPGTDKLYLGKKSYFSFRGFYAQINLLLHF